MHRKDYQLASNVATNTTTTPVTIEGREFAEGTLQVEISAAATVQLEGHIGGVLDASGDPVWCPVGDPITESGGVIVAAFQRYRLVITDNTGRVDAAIYI